MKSVFDGVFCLLGCLPARDRLSKGVLDPASSQTASRYRERDENMAYEPGSEQAKLLEKVECPVCWKPGVPPYYECENHHITCSQCIPRCESCPLCRQTLGMNSFSMGRNLFWPLAVYHNQELGDQVGDLFIQCANSEYGCLAYIRLKNRLDHEKRCVYR